MLKSKMETVLVRKSPMTPEYGALLLIGELDDANDRVDLYQVGGELDRCGSVVQCKSSRLYTLCIHVELALDLSWVHTICRVSVENRCGDGQVLELEQRVELHWDRLLDFLDLQTGTDDGVDAGTVCLLALEWHSGGENAKESSCDNGRTHFEIVVLE